MKNNSLEAKKTTDDVTMTQQKHTVTFKKKAITYVPELEIFLFMCFPRILSMINGQTISFYAIWGILSLRNNNFMQMFIRKLSNKKCLQFIQKANTDNETITKSNWFFQSKAN